MPVEQGSIAAALGRYACWQQLHRLVRLLFDLAEIFTANRIPEAVGGLPRDADHPTRGSTRRRTPRSPGRPAAPFSTSESK